MDLPSSFPRLLGDVGGTNARFALQFGPGEAPLDVEALRCRDHAGIAEAIEAYLSPRGRPVVRQAAIGIANPVTGDSVQMTNHHWAFSIEAVRCRLGLDRLLVLNDFKALALALPVLPREHLRQVGGGEPVPEAPLALLGAGTGLGVSALWPATGRRKPLPMEGEGGHVTLAAADDDEQAIVARLRQRFGHASAERALSGPGLVNLYVAVCEVEGVAAEPLGPAEVTDRGLAGHDARCRRAVDLFFSLLGSVAGNLALTLGARGGVYIGGGIVPRLGDAIDRSPFRLRFEQKGRFAAYLRDIPVYVLHSPVSPALLGASRALDDL
jgi:glucokinase